MDSQLEFSKTPYNKKCWRYELIKEVTGVNINQDCLESCHPLPSKEKEQDYS